MTVPGTMPEQLIQYWVHGKGAAKIRWGTPGDFKRCVRALSKYFPRNPEGLCNRLHTRALGVPPGQEHALVADAGDVLVDDGSDVDDLIDEAELAMFPTKTMWRGRLAPIGVPTGDRRRFERGGIGHRDLPLPLLYQLQTQEGHQQSVVVARILGITIDDDEARGYGDWLDTEHTAAAQQRLAQGVGGVSVDLDDLEYELRVPGTDKVWLASEQCGDESCAAHEFVVTKGRIAAATIVAIPAFAEAQLELYEGIDEEGLMAAFDELAGGGPEKTEAESCGCGVTAAALASYIQPVEVGLTAATPPVSFLPPAAAFANPGFTELTGVTLDVDRFPGYVAIYGHIGDWNVKHVGLPNQRLPRSRTGYAYFHVGSTYTAEGDEIATGKLLWGGKHPSMQAGMREAAQHYDDTSRAVAVAVAGEDEFGLYVAGVLLPWVTEEVKLDLMISPFSGDWRPVGGNLELIAALAVNTPGFPVVRARQQAGALTALVASAGPAPRILVERQAEAVVRWDAATQQAIVTQTGGYPGSVTIDLGPVIAPYVAQQVQLQQRRTVAAGIIDSFKTAIRAEEARVLALMESLAPRERNNS